MRSIFSIKYPDKIYTDKVKHTVITQVIIVKK